MFAKAAYSKSGLCLFVENIRKARLEINFYKTDIQPDRIQALLIFRKFL